DAQLQPARGYLVHADERVGRVVQLHRAARAVHGGTAGADHVEVPRSLREAAVLRLPLRARGSEIAEGGREAGPAPVLDRAVVRAHRERGGTRVEGPLSRA